MKISAGAATPVHHESQLVEAYSEERSLYIGPYPPASKLQALKDVYPDAPKIIFEQFQQEPLHRRALEEMTVKANLERESRGQIFAFAFAMVMAGLAYFSVYWKAPWVAGALGLGTVATVDVAFLTGGHSPMARI